MIKKIGVEINPGHYKTHYVHEDEPSTSKKAEIRYKIENIVKNEFELEDEYDIYDMFSDLANAFNDVLDGKKATKNILKWKKRQSLIKKILKQR